VSSIFTALTSLVKYVADPYDELPAIVFWLMGSLATVRYGDLLYIALPMFTGALVLFLLRWRINILSLGDEEAKALGMNVEKMRLIIIVCATLMTSAAVSISGVIGWIGLVVDDLSRTIAATEIPLGILTSLVGAPLFAYLIKRGRMGWN